MFVERLPRYLPLHTVALKSMPEMQKLIVISLALLALASAGVCPDGGVCEDGHTCCKDPADGYECCPLHQAECCEDHIHCCPEGTLCMVTESRCANESASVPWSERVSAKPPGRSKSFRMIKSYMGEDEDNICPDQSRCPAEFSCLMAFTRFGCCPLGQGVPCSDGKHCCARGHQCSADSRSCIKLEEPVNAVMCKGESFECPDGTTCCETQDGNWGCCPMPKAVCCEDKVHCCPEGSTCDVQQLKCLSSADAKELPMWAKFPARKRAEWENQKEQSADVVAQAISDNNLPEKVPEITAANTFPPSKDEEVSTSPVTQAEEQSADVVAQAISDNNLPENVPEITAANTFPPSVDEEVSTSPVARAEGNDVSCDGSVACPDGTTCCKTTEGTWSCCPLPEAVCCEDLIHCCPHGTICNLAAQTCDKAEADKADKEGDSSSLPWLSKVAALPWEDKEAHDVVCDPSYSCPDETTCCKKESGDWACCPLSEAVCCEDHQHCCPHDTTCDLASLSCQSSTGLVAMVEKVPAFTTSAPANTEAPPQSTEAPPQSTQAPPQSTLAPPQSTEAPPQSKEAPPQNTEAPPQSTEAPPQSLVSTTKAMELQTGEEDDEEEEQEEEEGDDIAEQEDDYDDEEEEEEEEGSVQCDSHTSCPHHTTCCFMKSSQKWGCCPLPDAVCCSDGEHCCPASYKCDVASTSCSKGEVVIPWYNKLPALNSVQPALNSVECDAQNRCPEDSSCCQLSNGQWGCCPLHKAVCCQDNEHCCPQGYSCDMGASSCQKLIMLQLQKVPLTRLFVPKLEPEPSVSKEKDVHCAGQVSCKDGETCCKTSATTWGCCPSPNAVCCSDMKHCCPAGYTCGDGGTCTLNSGLGWDNWQVFFSNKKRAQTV